MLHLIFVPHELLHDELLLVIQAFLILLYDHVVNVALQYLVLRIQYGSLLWNLCAFRTFYMPLRLKNGTYITNQLRQI